MNRECLWKRTLDRKKIFFLSFHANGKIQKILYTFTTDISWNSQIRFFISFRIYHLKDFGWKLMQEFVTQLSMLWCNLIMLKYSICDTSSTDIACHTSFVTLNTPFLQYKKAQSLSDIIKLSFCDIKIRNAFCNIKKVSFCEIKSLTFLRH